MRWVNRRHPSAGVRKGESGGGRAALASPCAFGRRGMLACLAMLCLIGGVCASRSVEQLVEPAIEQVRAASSPSVGYGAVLGDSSDPYELSAGDRGDAFADEVVSLVGRSDGRIDEGSRVIGWSCDGQASEVLGATTGELERKGWKKTGNDQAACASFSKESGRYRWAFVMCTQIGSSVSVVLQVA